MTTETEIREALAAAGVSDLAPAAKQWLAERIARWGYSPAAINVGGLRCTLPHEHGTGEGCIKVSVGDTVHHLARFPSWERAARALVATARRASASPAAPAADIPNVGYRSTHPVEGEGTGDALDYARAAAEIISPLGSQLLLGPSPEATFRGLLADWEAFERAGVPARLPELRETHDSWIKFRDQWLSGQGNEAQLSAAVEDANRVRSVLAQRAGQPDSPGTSPSDLTNPLAAAAWVTRQITSLARPSLPEKAKLPLLLGIVAAGGLFLFAVAARRGGAPTIIVQTAPTPAPAPEKKGAR